MEDLIRDTIAFLKEQPQKTVLASKEEFDYFRKVVEEKAPHLKFAKEVPSDARAKQQPLKMAQVWILSFGESGKPLEFLQNVAKAIEAHFSSAMIVDVLRFEKEQRWQEGFSSGKPRLILGPGIDKWKGTALSSLYQENPTTKTATLGGASFLQLKPIEVYFQSPEEKRKLWKELSLRLSS